MKRFEGKTAVITGGNSGIGLATAKQFHEEGAKVAISGRDQKTLDEAVKTIGPGTLAVKADVAKVADLDKFFAQVAAKFGKIDVLFANAGIAKFALAADSSEQMFDETFDINVKGLFFTLQKGQSRNQRIFGQQGRGAFAGPHFRRRIVRPRHSRERGQPGPDLHADSGQVRDAAVRHRRIRAGSQGSRSHETAGHSGRNRPCCPFPGQ